MFFFRPELRVDKSVFSCFGEVVEVFGIASSLVGEHSCTLALGLLHGALLCHFRIYQDFSAAGEPQGSLNFNLELKPRTH